MQGLAALLSTAISAAVLGLAGAGEAQPLAPSPGAPSGAGPVRVLVIVSSHGLNLGSPVGADLFLTRLTQAVDQACDDRRAVQPPAPARSAAFYACRQQALDEAMTYVRSPLVKRRYATIGMHDGATYARR